MGIRKRDIRAERSKSKGRLRHPLLKLGSVTLQLYNYVKANPHCLARDTHHITDHPQPISSLVHEGLLKAHGRIPRTYTAVPENETGKPRDKVSVKVRVFVNRFGEYSATCQLEGQKPTATDDFPQEVAGRTINIAIPHPDDPYAIREMVDINDRYTPVYTGNNADDLIIDADFEIISPNE